MRETRANARQHSDHPLGCRSQVKGVDGRLLGREGVGTMCRHRWHRSHPDVCPRLWVLQGRDGASQLCCARPEPHTWGVLRCRGGHRDDVRPSEPSQPPRGEGEWWWVMEQGGVRVGLSAKHRAGSAGPECDSRVWHPWLYGFGQVSCLVRTSVSSTVKWGWWSLTCRAVGRTCGFTKGFTNCKVLFNRELFFYLP